MSRTLRTGTYWATIRSRVQSRQHRSLLRSLLNRPILPCKHQIFNKIKESIPTPISPHFSLKWCLSSLSTTLPANELYFSLKLLSALIGCEDLKQLWCAINCYLCLAPRMETQKLPCELSYFKMIPTCIIFQKMGKISLWPNPVELTKTKTSPPLGEVLRWDSEKIS